jgi:hypothetical protein
VSILSFQRHVRPAVLALLASVALLVPALATTAPASAAPGDGTVTLSVVDPAGQQLGGSFYLIPVGADKYWDGVQATGLTPAVVVPPGGYGVLAISPWGGFLCAGVTPCSASVLTDDSTPFTVTPVVQVSEGGTTAYPLTAPAPAQILGGNTRGSARYVEYSAPMKELLSVYTLGIYGGVTTQWVRNGVDIPGATAPAYTVADSDVGTTLSTRLAWSGYIQSQFTNAGLPAGPRVLPGVAIARSRTTTTVDVFRSTITAGKSIGFRADVTSGSDPAIGTVRLKIGKVTITKKLRNGSVRGLLPRSLKPGKYKIVATYLGSSVFEPSTGTDRFKVKPASKNTGR